MVDPSGGRGDRGAPVGTFAVAVFDAAELDAAEFELARFEGIGRADAIGSSAGEAAPEFVAVAAGSASSAAVEVTGEAVSATLAGTERVAIGGMGRSRDRSSSVPIATTAATAAGSAMLRAARVRPDTDSVHSGASSRGRRSAWGAG